MDLKACDLCPRRCGADRTGGKRGVCGESDKVRIARAALHFYEEPCVSGTRGSGTVFFSGCSLKCVYCQNFALSRGRLGTEVGVSRLAGIFLSLQEQGAHNVNLVTPTHFSVQIREALREAKARGLSIPVVYNTSGYETAEAVRYLQDDVDVYLTDFKYADAALARSLSGAEDYPERAMEALSEMVRVVKEKAAADDVHPNETAVFDEEGIMRRGVIVRNLLLPGHVRNSKEVVREVYERFGNDVFFSVMNQYTPVRTVAEHPELNRTVTRREYDRLLDYVIGLGITNAFIQEGKTQKESFIPAFDGTGVEDPDEN